MSMDDIRSKYSNETGSIDGMFTSICYPNSDKVVSNHHKF